MSAEIITRNKQDLTGLGLAGEPAVVAGAGERASFRFIEFFTANIRNRHDTVHW